MNSSTNKRAYYIFIFIVVLFCMCSPIQSSSQQLGISYKDYLNAIGMGKDHIVLENILENELRNRLKNKEEAYYKDNAAFFSMVLLLSGIRPGYYYRLQQSGVDVIHAITADVRPFDEQCLLVDVVITGKVIRIVPESSDVDGYDITIYIEVSELLKGGVPGDTLKIRQRNVRQVTAKNVRPELNESYLLLLSSGMYGYHKANHQFRTKDKIVVSPPDLGHEDTFVIYRIYPIQNGQIIQSPQNKSEAFSAIRKVNRLINSQQSSQ